MDDLLAGSPSSKKDGKKRKSKQDKEKKKRDKGRETPKNVCTEDELDEDDEDGDLAGSRGSPMAEFSYIVTAQHPTSISHAFTGCFTSPSSLNLILGKVNRFEIHLATQAGLTALYDVPIYGRIAIMNIFRPAGATQDQLFICTERAQFCVLGFDKNTNKITTQRSGDLRHKNGRRVPISPIGIVDPLVQVIALHLYDGFLQILSIKNGTVAESVLDVRLDDLHVVHMCFLHGYDKPTLLVLSETTNYEVQLKSYVVNIKSGELEPGPWKRSVVNKTTTKIFPVPSPFNGVLVLSREDVVYRNNEQTVAVPLLRPTEMQALGMIDKTRYVLGDLTGNFYVLVLKCDADTVMELVVERLGKTTIANEICYLDSGICFVASTKGDSQLIRLNEERDEHNSCVELLEEFPNIGPIQDFCMVDIERQGRKQGQPSMVCCAGAFRDGSLRIVRNGIGIHEEASIDLPGIKAIWSLFASTATQHHKYLVESFVTETRVLAMDGEALEEAEIPGFQTNVQSLYCGNVTNNRFVQITIDSVRLVDCATLQLTSSWAPPGGERITVADADETSVLLSTGAGRLVLLSLDGAKISETKHVTLDLEIACISLGQGTDLSGRVAAVAVWTNPSVRVLTLPELQEQQRSELEQGNVPRSLVFWRFGTCIHLLCGLGDGHLVTWVYETTKLSNKKLMSLGTQRVLLTKFVLQGKKFVFAGCDRPTLIRAPNKKLYLSNVNLTDVSSVASFHTETFPDCLAFASEETLRIGGLDDIQKLHITKVALDEHPRRIAYQPAARSVVVLTIHFADDDARTCNKESNFVRVFDVDTFENTSSFELDATEYGSAIISGLTFGGEQSFVVVGTAFVKEEEEPSSGRILVFSVSTEEGQLSLVTSLKVQGAVYTLASVGDMLLAGVNNSVTLYQWESQQLQQKYATHGNFCVQEIKTDGEYILVADVMKSVSLLVYHPQQKSLEEVARDFEVNYMTACEMMKDGVYFGATHSFNIFTCKRVANAETEEDKSRLTLCGRFHLGEMINCIREGGLVLGNTTDTEETRIVPSHLFGTVNGMIGVLAPLTKEQFHWLKEAEKAVLALTDGTGVGLLKHADWREVDRDGRKPEKSKGFIDGDVIERFLDLSEEDMKQVASKLNSTVAAVFEKIEDLSRIH